MQENTKDELKINHRFLMAVSAVIFLGTAVTTALFVKNNDVLNKKLAQTAETSRPANLELVMINDKTCPDCFDTAAIINQIKKEGVKIDSDKNIDRSSDEGKQLIAKFAIKKLPTFLVKGELKKNSVLANFFSQAGDTIDDTFVFRQVGGPYFDTATNKVKGKVNLVLITDVTCTQCYDVAQHEAILKQFGITTAAKVADIKSDLGKALIKAYGIKMVPAFVLTGEIKEYPSLTSVWSQVGFVAKDGAYVFTKGVPFMGTYKDLATNKVVTPAPETSN
ncbi:MAG: hypothetical protein G01um101413_529 [Parcubacteria group bacterium Gr01-1014_13]|nr:MAG: hypothetical protein G01um101413_529 [Parcubacteria group bacterium Gr01-1014_13]